MASNSTTPNEGGLGDDDNNSQERNKNAATWKLLTKYIDRFVKEEDYNEYANIIQKATGASDEVIARAIRFRNSPYSSEEQLQQQIRLHTWSDHAKKRNCYWYPFCGKAVSCGGNTKEKCSMYGTGGTTTPPSNQN